MNKFLFNLIWYLLAVVLVDLLPLGVFFRLHGTELFGTVAPTIIASALFFILIAVQAFAHLHQMHKRYPGSEESNVWTTLVVTFLVAITFPAIVAVLIAWVLSS